MWRGTPYCGSTQYLDGLIGLLPPRAFLIHTVAGLYLVEQVQLTRNPQVSIWSDTWLRETAQVVAPRAQAQLESDQDALLQQFIHALQ